MGRKTKKQKLIEKINDELLNCYHVSARDLASGTFYHGWDAVQVEDVIPFFESQYGVELKKQEFGNWSEFANVVASKVLEK